MPNYQLGKIYKISSSKTDKIYIGSTCQVYLSYRLSGHKTEYKNWKSGESKKYVSSFETLQFDDAEIELLESYPCSNKDELHAREKYHIMLNKEMAVNKHIPMQTPKEYRENNKAEIQVRKREYHEKNKEVINEKKREQYRNDEVVREKSHDQGARYYKENKEKASALRKVWRETHKQEKKAMDKAYHTNNIDKIKEYNRMKKRCVTCDEEVTQCNYARHLKTPRHLSKRVEWWKIQKEWLEQQT